MLILWKRCTAMPKRAAIRGYDIRVVFLGAVMAHNLELVVFREDILHVCQTNIRFSLVGPFMPYIRLSMESNLVTVIFLSRVLVIL